jgi:hypothetical protein
MLREQFKVKTKRHSPSLACSNMLSFSFSSSEGKKKNSEAVFQLLN